jgi:hypothetical protein
MACATYQHVRVHVHIEPALRLARAVVHPELLAIVAGLDHRGSGANDAAAEEQELRYRGAATYPLGNSR